MSSSNIGISHVNGSSQDPSITVEEGAAALGVANPNSNQSEHVIASTTSDLPNVPTNGHLLSDFLSLVEPISAGSLIQSTHEDDSSTIPRTTSAGSTTVGDHHRYDPNDEENDHSTNHNSISATPVHAQLAANQDPRLSAIDTDQLQPLATLFTKFYEEQVTSTKDVLPEYQRVVDSMDLPVDSKDALSEVLSAIDRLALMSNETMQDQRVTLTQDKQAEMAAITLAMRIQKLAARLDSQRVEMQPSRKSALNTLFGAIERSGQQLTNQRVIMGDALERRIDLARVGALVEKLDRSRLENQDWKSPQYMLETDMCSLSKRLDRTDPSYNHQRFVLSGQKQRDMFMDEMMKRLRRMHGRRLDNQDAQAPPDFLSQQKKTRTNRFSMSDCELAPKEFDTQRVARRNTVEFL